MSDHDNNNVHESHESVGDRIHHVTAYLEHLMDIFEIGIAIIVAFGFITDPLTLEAIPTMEWPLSATLSPRC